MQVFETKEYRRVRILDRPVSQTLFCKAKAAVEGAVITLIAFGEVGDELATIEPGTVLNSVTGCMEGQLGVIEIRR